MTALDLALESFNKDTTLKINSSAIMDINVNSMIVFNDNCFKSFTNKDSISTSEIALVSPQVNSKQVFKKLFPVDSIIKQNRPQGAGIKYAILGDIPQNSWGDPKGVNYDFSYRTYYPGDEVKYKYWLTAKDANASITVYYNNSTLDKPTYPKDILCNKIVVKFEVSHATPSHWYIYGNKQLLKDGTSVSSNEIDKGSVAIYWTGTVWSLNESDLNLTATPKTLSSLSLHAVNPGGYIGVIEIAPHLVYDLTDYFVSFTTSKESSNTTQDLLPVGNVTANSLSLQLIDLTASHIKFNTYSRDSQDQLDVNEIYLVKNAEIKPFLKIYDSNGDLTDSAGKYFKLNQGYFYIDSWDISEYGNIDITALDSAKFLQDIFCPQILCTGYTVIAIIRRVLDSVGFNNYTINTNPSQEKESSIFTPDYWWTDGTETAWSVIQDLCRDSQMICFMDDNNILQFYTRSYIFDSDRSIDYIFRDAEETISGTKNIPNILTLSKKKIPGVSSVRVRYSPTGLAGYDQSSKEVLEYTNTYLAAAGLKETLSISAVSTATLLDHSTDHSGCSYINLDMIDITASDLSTQSSLYAFAGYFLLDAEVIEFDSIQYEYIPLTGGAAIQVDIASPGDISKYSSLAVIGSVKNLGKYRIKTRGCFNTVAKAHPVDLKSISNGWNGYSGIKWVTS